ncbi:unnamed protein product [Mucor hiemalis]
MASSSRITELPSDEIPQFYHLAYDQVILRLRAFEIELEDPAIINTLTDIMQRNMIVTDQELLDKLRLMPYEGTENNISQNGYYFYIRSWKISAAAIQQIMDEFASEGVYSSIIESWFVQMSFREEQPFYYLRYVGYCRAPSDPKKRLEDDFKRSYGFMSRVFKKFDALPENEQPTVSLFVLESKAITLIEQRLFQKKESVDRQEQVLINIFGVDQRLNSQPGGENAKYTPEKINFTEYVSIVKPAFFKNHKKRSKKPENEHAIIKDRLKGWCHSLMQTQRTFDREIYTRHRNIRNPNYAMSEEYIKAIYSLTKPAGYISGRTVLFMIGNDITVRNFFDAKPILNPDSSRAGYVLCDMLERLYSWENGNYNNYNVASALKRFRGKIPFVNLIPWLEDAKLTIQQGLVQLTQYLNIVQPLVAVTFSRQVTSCALANFAHESGLDSRANLIEYVGLPRVVSYDRFYLDDDTYADAPPPGSNMIIIPHFDPGLDRHTKRTMDGARAIMDISWKISLYVAQIATEVSKENQNPNASRDRIVNSIMSRCEGEPQLQYLFEQLEFSKDQYKTQEIQDRGQYPHGDLLPEVISDMASRGAKTRGENAVLAEGRPMSLERIAQSKTIWKMNLRSLHALHPREEKNKWIRWFLSVEEGRNVVYSAMASVRNVKQTGGYDQRTREIVQRYKPSQMSLEEVLSDDEVRRNCLKAWGKAVSSQRTTPLDVSAEKQSERGRRSQELRIQRQGYRFNRNVQGQRTKINVRGYAPVYWVNDEEENVILKIQLPGFKVSAHARLEVDVHVTAEGLEFRPTDPNTGARTLSVKQELLAEDTQVDAYRMWESAAVTLNLIHPLQRRPVVLAETIVRGHPLPANKKISIDENTVIVEGDALFVLLRYLQQIDFTRVRVICFLHQQEHFNTYAQKKNMIRTSVEFFLEGFRNQLGKHQAHPRRILRQERFQFRPPGGKAISCIELYLENN